MRTLGWALSAVGAYVAGFVAMWIVDASVPHAYNLIDPVLWIGAVVLGSLGLAGLARYRDAEARPVLQGVLAGLAGFVVVLLVLYLVVFAGMGID